MKVYCLQGHFGLQKRGQGHPHYNQGSLEAFIPAILLCFCYFLFIFSLKVNQLIPKHNSKRPIRPAVRSVRRVPHELGPQ